MKRRREVLRYTKNKQANKQSTMLTKIDGQQCLLSPWEDFKGYFIWPADTKELGTIKVGIDRRQYIVALEKRNRRHWKCIDEEDTEPTEPIMPIEPVKTKKPALRKAPRDGAKFYEVGRKMMGLDGKIYIVTSTKNGAKRWARED
jgi:hypothetical protein